MHLIHHFILVLISSLNQLAVDFITYSFIPVYIAFITDSSTPVYIDMHIQRRYSVDSYHICNAI